ncbi:MAG: helix-turn-helix domain-containing protein [Janthinobacterium lividum]
MQDTKDDKDEEAQGSGSLNRTKVDVHVGGRIHLRRAILGMTQTALADVLGVSFQQVQKYESGMNRVSASRLYDISKALKTPISFFFSDIMDDLDDVKVSIGTQAGAYRSDHLSIAAITDDLYSIESRKLILAYYRIDNPEVRKRLLELIQSMSPDDT